MAEDGGANQRARRVEDVLMREDHPRIIIISDDDREAAIPFAAFGKSLVISDDDDDNYDADADVFIGNSILGSIFGSSNGTETGPADKGTSTTRTPKPFHSLIKDAESLDPAAEVVDNASSAGKISGFDDKTVFEASQDGDWSAQDAQSAIPADQQTNDRENEILVPGSFPPIVSTGTSHTGAEYHAPTAEAVLGATSSGDHGTQEANDSPVGKQTDDEENKYHVSVPLWPTKTIVTASAETKESESSSEAELSSEDEASTCNGTGQPHAPNAPPALDQSKKKEKKKKKENKKPRGWSDEEQDGLAESVRHVVENGGRDEGEWKMWEKVQERLSDVHGVQKTAHACRNWYCRKLREVTGFDERKNPNPDRLVTCAQK